MFMEAFGNKNPIIKVQHKNIDKILLVISYLLFIFSLLYTQYLALILKDTIAIHFNFSGEVDGYGDKNFLYFSMLIIILLFVTINYLISKPHKLNYTDTITENNAPKKYLLMIRILRILQILVLCIDIIINYNIMTQS